ncbi:hypothetical protein DMENIID0001_074770 [Sergentomyia squamirostris]
MKTRHSEKGGEKGNRSNISVSSAIFPKCHELHLGVFHGGATFDVSLRVKTGGNTVATTVEQFIPIVTPLNVARPESSLSTIPAAAWFSFVFVDSFSLN